MKIAIVGQGILGSLIAYYLSQQREYTLTLYDDGERSASQVAAGMLAPFTELEKSPHIVNELGRISMSLWPGIINNVDPSLYFKTLGTLVVAHPLDQALTQPYLDKINQTSQTTPYKQLNQQQLSHLEPELTAFQSACFFQDEGQIDNQSLIVKLSHYLINKKIEKNQEAVTQTKPYCVVTKSGVATFDLVIDARGNGGNTHFDDLRGVRGELIWLVAPEVKISRPVRLLHPRYSLYLAPRSGQTYLIGASEIESSDTSAISVRSALELLSAATSIHKGFYEARVIKTATGLRPTLNHGEPRIKFTAGIIAINGLYRHGFLLAPALSQLVAGYVATQTIHSSFTRLWEQMHDQHHV